MIERRHPLSHKSAPGLVHMPRRDRGPTPFFHGRTVELAAFQGVLDDACHSKGGIIFLVQGPPGAGKSALLDECAKRARKDKWCVASIKSRALHDAGELARKLGLRRADQVIDHTSREGRLGVRAGSEISFKGDAGEARKYRGDAIEDLLQTAVAGRKGVLLLLDEAQNMATGMQTREENKAAISENLELIHNGEVGVPVVLLCGGLGTTQSVIRFFGVSRLAEGAVFNLEALGPAEAAGMVRDWLIRSGVSQRVIPIYPVGSAPWWISVMAGPSICITMPIRQSIGCGSMGYNSCSKCQRVCWRMAAKAERDIMPPVSKKWRNRTASCWRTWFVMPEKAPC